VLLGSLGKRADVTAASYGDEGVEGAYLLIEGLYGSRVGEVNLYVAPGSAGTDYFVPGRKCFK
jgi:hypothetical protein